MTHFEKLPVCSRGNFNTKKMKKISASNNEKKLTAFDKKWDITNRKLH